MVYAGGRSPPDFNEPFYVGFNVGGYELGLLPDGESIVAYWGTPDFSAEHAHLIALGAKPNENPSAEDGVLSGADRAIAGAADFASGLEEQVLGIKIRFDGG